MILLCSTGRPPASRSAGALLSRPCHANPTSPQSRKPARRSKPPTRSHAAKTRPEKEPEHFRRAFDQFDGYARQRGLSRAPSQQRPRTIQRRDPVHVGGASVRGVPPIACVHRPTRPPTNARTEGSVAASCAQRHSPTISRSAASRRPFRFATSGRAGAPALNGFSFWGRHHLDRLAVFPAGGEGAPKIELSHCRAGLWADARRLRRISPAGGLVGNRGHGAFAGHDPE